MNSPVDDGVMSWFTSCRAIGPSELQQIPPLLKQFSYDHVHNSRSYTCAIGNHPCVSPHAQATAESLLGEEDTNHLLQECRQREAGIIVADSTH